MERERERERQTHTTSDEYAEKQPLLESEMERYIEGEGEGGRDREGGRYRDIHKARKRGRRGKI